MEEKTVKTFATPEGCKLVVENIKGKIVVEGWDQSETEVTAVRHQEWAEVEIEQDGKKVVARTKHPAAKDKQGIGQLLNWITPGRTPIVDYIMRVPYTSDVKLKNVNGPIEVRQIEGKVRVNNVDGPVMVKDTKGDIRVETVNGTLNIAQFDGTADLKTVNGELSLQNGTLDKLSSQTVNGNCKIVAALADDGKYTFNTVNGNCTLHVPADFRARVSAHGVNLHVDCAQPAQSIRRQFGNWQGIIGPEQEAEPTAEIVFHTVNGHLSIANTGPAEEPAAEYVAKAEAVSEPPDVPQAPEPPEAPQPPAPPEPPATIEVKVDETPSGAEEPGEPQPKSQLDVLQMVERGEMTVEEAIKLLED